MGSSFWKSATALLIGVGAVAVALWTSHTSATPGPVPVGARLVPADVAPGAQERHALDMIGEGRRTFRFDTFGDEAFWDDAPKLHRAIPGAKLGGVGPGLNPKAALEVGLKVDVLALTPALVRQLQANQVNLDDPATTVALLKLDAVVCPRPRSTTWSST